MDSCFPMLSEAYASALQAESERESESEGKGTVFVPPVTFPGEARDAPAPDEDMETARTRPLPFDTIRL